MEMKHWLKKSNSDLFFLRLEESNSLASPPRFQAYRGKDPEGIGSLEHTQN
jgi:hypothetical protein